MDEIVVGGHNALIKFCIEEVYGYPNQTSYLGGYDTKGFIEVKSGNFFGKIDIWQSTKEFFDLYKKLYHCYLDLSGEVKYISYECELEVNLIFDRKGHVLVNGIIINQIPRNELKFEFESDQSYINQSLEGLKSFIGKYDNPRGFEDI